MMKKILFGLAIIFTTQQIFSQEIGIVDFGKSFYTIQNAANSQFGNTCEGEGKVLIYCVSDGSKVMLMFRNNKFSDLQIWTPYSSKRIAELELERQVKDFAKEHNMTPNYSNGLTTFTTLEMEVGATFKIVEYNRSSYVQIIYQYKPLLSYPITEY